MNFNFAPLRLLLLALCLGLFAAFGGFSEPHVSAILQGSSADGWLDCILLFIAGAVCVSLIDHRVGLREPTNLRPLYIILGLISMAAALAWLSALKHAP
ncbi:hypothetical protein BH09VER1_BH09VER1_48310 [soil metagenome]